MMSIYELQANLSKSIYEKMFDEKDKKIIFYIRYKKNIL